MTTQPEDIQINIQADGASDVINLLRDIERNGQRMGNGINRAGQIASRGLDIARGAARGLNGVLNTTANSATAIFSGAIAGGMAVGSAFNAAETSVSSLKNFIMELRNASIEAAQEVKNLNTVASAFQIQGDNAAGKTDAYFSAIASLSLDAEVGDVADFVNDISTKVQEAIAGDEAAIEILTGFGISVDELHDKTGRLIDPIEQLMLIIDKSQNLSTAKRNNLLELIVGTGGVRQFASVLESSSERVRELYDEFLKLNGITDDTVDAAYAISDSQFRLESALAGSKRALMTGMALSIKDSNEEMTAFVSENRERIIEAGELVGDFSGEVLSRLMEFVRELDGALSGPTGKLIDGPIKEGLDALLSALDWILDRLTEIAQFVGQGQSVDWIDSLIEKFDSARKVFSEFTDDLETLVELINTHITPLFMALHEALGSLYEQLGLESNVMTFALTGALVLMGGKILGVVAIIGTAVAKMISFAGAFSGVTDAITASAEKMSGAVKQSVGKVADAAKASTGRMATSAMALAKAGGVVATTAAIGVGIYEAPEYQDRAKLYEQVAEIYKTAGTEAAAAYANAMEQYYKSVNGSPITDSILSWIPGLSSQDDLIIEMQANINGLSEKEILAKTAEAFRLANTKLPDYFSFEVGDLTFTGMQINNEVERQLASIPATIEVTAITGLQEELDRFMGEVESRRSIASAEGATGGSMQPANIYFNGENVGTVSASSDQLRALQLAAARSGRK